MKTAITVVLFLVFSHPVYSQTYTVAPNATAKPQGNSGATQAGGQSLGFGTNIQNARLARAAQLALERGDHPLALDYAQRAAQAAPNDPQIWFLLGYAARLDGKTQLAVQAYSHGLRLKPSDLQGMSGLAQTYSLMGRTADAERILKQVIAADPKRRDDTLLLGDIYMRSGDYTTALDWLGKAERLQPDARSELLMAICYQRLKQLDKASHYLNLARRRAPNNPDVERSLAAYYREIGNYPQAIAALKAIHNPKPDVKAELGYTYQLDGKLHQAARVYAEAANAVPRDLGLQLSAAQAQVAVGSIEDATPFLQRAQGINPDSYRLHAIRGEIAQLQDRDEDAVREYSAAVAHLPPNPIEGPLYGIQLHMNLVDLYRNLDEPDQSNQQLQIAQTEIGALHEHGPDRPLFLRLRAMIKLDAGQPESALNDIKEALALSPDDPNNLQLDGDLLMKLGRTQEAIAVYKRVLGMNPRSRFALTSLGYASRAAGNDQDAEKYFKQLAQDYPGLYVPYLALGDLYASQRQYKKALASYSKGYSVAPKNALIVAGGISAAIEEHKLPLAGKWLARVTPKMENVPQVLREKERYLSFEGHPRQSAEIGERAIKLLPHDREVVVYLGYDLLRLDRYDELLALTNKYKDAFPTDPNIPLLAGYVHKHNGQVDQAVQDFTEALNRDPNVVTAYVNRGYLLNDLVKPSEASADFEQALKREPRNAEAHIGLAFADLELNHSQAAIRQTQLAEQVSGDSETIHTIRATAYGREGLLTKAIGEYRAALKFAPNDGALYLGMGSALFAQQRFHQAIQQLEIAQKYLPENPELYALLARAYAHLQDREDTMRNVKLAEQYAARNPAPSKNNTGSQLSDIYISTAEALSTLGDEKAAMERLDKALVAPHSNRAGVRLAVAKLMADKGHSEDAQRQIALAEMEAEAGDTAPLTGVQYIQAADVLQQLHEYRLSQTYVQKARDAGASDIAVRVAAANNYLALGDTLRAAAELAAVSREDGSQSDYQYLRAQASVYQQEHHSTQALSAFAQAASAAGEDQTSEQDVLQAGANEGYRVNPRLSLLSDVIVQPIFVDSTINVLDSKLFGKVPVPPTDFPKLPPPISSLETEWTTAFHLHVAHLPTPGGFFQLRNAEGQISNPPTNSIENRNTFDYILNLGVNPTLHLGKNVLQFNTGVQGDIRRDTLSPYAMNQNLFRVFTYLTTTSFFNAVSVSGYGIYEFGPFTENNIHSKAFTGAVDFRVGRPWAKTALVTGWGMNDQIFQPVGIEDYYTSTYIGLAHRFSRKWSVEGILEDLRAWEIVQPNSGISQAVRPAATFDYSPTRHWNIEASSAYERAQGFHVYDMTQNGISLSYVRPFGSTFNDQTGEVHVKYPIRLSGGVQEATFPNFTYGHNGSNFEPYVSITLF